MKHRFIAAAIGFMLIGSSVHAQENQVPVSFHVDKGPQQVPPQVRAAAERMMANGSSPFTIAVGQGSEEIRRIRVGDITSDTQYPIMSATKFLTAATVMSIVDEGKLSLDAPISTWLPKIGGDAGKLTLRQLLSQTSGLPQPEKNNEFVQDYRLPLTKAAEQLLQTPLASQPGSTFKYGGPGFQVAGALVEAVTGEPWTKVFERKIARPLGMSHTFWTHVASTPEGGFLPVATPLNPTLQGGVVSTSEDYMRFLSMMAQGGVYEGKRILSQASIHAMLTDQTSAARMTPTGASVLPDAHYGLGSWCETWNAKGQCDRNSSIGLWGVYPWVEQNTGRYGIIFVFNRDNAFQHWADMEAIRDHIWESAGETK